MDTTLKHLKQSATDFYSPTSLKNRIVSPELAEQITSLRQRYQIIIDARQILTTQFSKRQLLEAYRVSLFEHLNALALNPERIADLLATFYDVLDSAKSLPIIMQKLQQMGDGTVDIIAAEDAARRLLDALETQYTIWFALNEAAALDNAMTLQTDVGKVTAASKRVLSERRIELALIRIKLEEYEILQERLSFVRQTIQTLSQLRELIKSINFNLQKVGEWLMQNERGGRTNAD